MFPENRTTKEVQENVTRRSSRATIVSTLITLMLELAFVSFVAVVFVVLDIQGQRGAIEKGFLNEEKRLSCPPKSSPAEM